MLIYEILPSCVIDFFAVRTNRNLNCLKNVWQDNRLFSNPRAYFNLRQSALCFTFLLVCLCVIALP